MPIPQVKDDKCPHCGHPIWGEDSEDSKEQWTEITRVKIIDGPKLEIYGKCESCDGKYKLLKLFEPAGVA